MWILNLSLQYSSNQHSQESHQNPKIKSKFSASHRFFRKIKKFLEIIFLPTTHHIARTDNKLMLQKFTHRGNAEFKIHFKSLRSQVDPARIYATWKLKKTLFSRTTNLTYVKMCPLFPRTQFLISNRNFSSFTHFSPFAVWIFHLMMYADVFEHRKAKKHPQEEKFCEFGDGGIAE